MKKIVSVLSITAMVLFGTMIYGFENPSNAEQTTNYISEKQTFLERSEPVEKVGQLTIEEMISITCKSHGIPDEIPLAISKLETGHFTSEPYLCQNNPGGMMSKTGPITYGTIEEGVEAFVSNLADNYFAQGLTTPETIAPKYCPPDSAEWAKLVRQLM